MLEPPATGLTTAGNSSAAPLRAGSPRGTVVQSAVVTPAGRTRRLATSLSNDMAQPNSSGPV